MENNINLGVILERLHEVQKLQRDFLLEVKRRQIVKEIVDGEDWNLWEHEEDDLRERIDLKLCRNARLGDDC